jgi:hypothetical protein
MTGRICLCVGLLLFFSHAQADDVPSPQWLVVTAPAFRTAIEPLCTQRKAQGMRVRVLVTTETLTPEEIARGKAEKLHDRIKEVLREAKGPRYLLLVGAVNGADVRDADKLVPPLAGTSGRMKGQPCDSAFGRLGDDARPEVPVGRFPARSEDEAKGMVARTLAYENDTRPGEWRRQLTVLAGIPGFNPTLDALVEQVAIAQLGKLDPSWTGRVIYHQQQSRFCVPDEELHKRARQYVADGQALTLYLGHSSAEGFYGGRARFLDRDDWSTLRIARGPGIFVTFGCNGCQLRGRNGEGYGLAAIRNPHGPVAVIGSHGICFAAMNDLAAQGFAATFLGPDPPERLGACWLRMRASLAKKALPLYFPLLDAADGDPAIPASIQRLEHLEMFVFLGDPALRLPVLAQDMRLGIEGEAGPGKTLVVRGQLPARLAGAQVLLTIERPTTSQPTDLVPLPKLPGPARDLVMADNHEKANRFVLASARVKARDHRFECRMELPARLPWPQLIVRAYAFTPRQDGLGISRLPVKSP